LLVGHEKAHVAAVFNAFQALTQNIATSP